MPNWIYWAAAIAVADVFLVLFFHGAQRKENPREFRRIRSLEKL
ncbi:hypothetical protein [Paraburkholderia tropica]|nr:hypothetical protein [Paraburkholderia tropica]